MTPHRVLIVDDSRTVHLMIRSCLRDENVELSFAISGAEGLALASSAEPDLILLDVEMPTTNGFEICRQLKSDERTAAIPIVFLTAHCSTSEKVKGLDLGAIDYVTIPFDPPELCARVRASLRNKYMFDLLAQKVMIDGLTGLWNRAYLDKRLVAEIAMSNRHGQPLSIIMADVDQFKSINDAHGHPFGDEVLRHIAQTMVSTARKEDVICRYGGEELAILTPGVCQEGARGLAERVRRSIHEHKFRHRDVDLRVSCSFGVAQHTPDRPDPLIEVADAALYRAKQSGRNCVVCASSDAVLVQSSAE